MTSKVVDLMERLSLYDAQCKEAPHGTNNERELDLSTIVMQDSECVSYFISWLIKKNDTTSPTDINFSHCQLSDSSIQSILKTIMSNSTIRSLDLSFNKMNTAAVSVLLDLMRRNKCLESINIFGNDLFDDKSVKNKQVLEELVSEFQNSQTWRSITGCKILKPSLYYKPDGKYPPGAIDEETELIVTELKKNMDLKDLSFDGVNFSRSALFKILSALARNNTLLSLTIHNLRPSLFDSYGSGEGFSNSTSTTISHPQLKTLCLHMLKGDRDNEIMSVRFAECLSWIRNNLISGSKLTSLQLDNLPNNGSASWTDELLKILDSNRTIMHFAFFRCQWNEAQLDRVFNALSRNEVVRLMQFDDVNMPIIESFQAKLKDLVLLRSTPLLLRFGGSREIMFKDINGRQCGTEWQVGDQVETLVDDNSWIKSKIIMISEEMKYGICFNTGQIKTNIRSPLLRKPDNFNRECTIQRIEDFLLKKEYPSLRSNNIDHLEIHRNSTFSQSSPYFFGQRVYARVIGDCRWYNATVVKVLRGERQSDQDSGFSSYYLLDIEFDDGLLIQEIEEHLISIVNMEETSSIYDVGIYQRGDYVEMYKVSDESPGLYNNRSIAWRRGRVAFDKKNGCYDLRFENGQDELNVRGRYMRHHFRSKDKVDVRLQGSNEWISGRVIAAEKNGTYHVSYDGDSNNLPSFVMKILRSNERVKLNEDKIEEIGVSSKRLMPHGRNSLREKAKEAASLIFHQVSAMKSSNVVTKAHSIDLSEENTAFQTESRNRSTRFSDDVNDGYQSQRGSNKDALAKRIDATRRGELDGERPKTADRTKNQNSSNVNGNLVAKFEQLNLAPSGDEDFLSRNDSPEESWSSSIPKLQKGSKVYAFDQQLRRYDLFLIESINADRSLNLKNVKGYIMFNVNPKNVMGEADYSKLDRDRIAADERNLRKNATTRSGRALFKVGSRVECNIDGTEQWYPAVVAQHKGNGLYAVILDEEDNERHLPPESIRPIRSFVENSFDNRLTHSPSLNVEQDLGFSVSKPEQSRHDDDGPQFIQGSNMLIQSSPNNSPLAENRFRDQRQLSEVVQEISLHEESPAKPIPWKPVEITRPVIISLREGTRVEYRSPNHPELILQGCIQRIDQHRGLCELLLDDGTVVNNIDPQLVNPVKKSLMRSPKPSGVVTAYTNNFVTDNFQNSREVMDSTIVAPSTPQSTSRGNSNYFMSPDQVSMPMKTSTPMSSSGTPSTPFRPPMSIRSTNASPRAGTMIARPASIMGLESATDPRSSKSPSQSVVAATNDLHNHIKLGLHYNISNLYAKPTGSSSIQSSTCPFFFYLTVNQPKNNDLFYFVVEIIIPSIFVLSCSHYVVNHFSEPLTLREHYFIDIPMQQFSASNKKIVVPMFLSLQRELLNQQSGSTGSQPTIINNNASVLLSRIEHEPQLVQVFLYHQYALVGSLECNLTSNKDISGIVDGSNQPGTNTSAWNTNSPKCHSIESFNFPEVGILDASLIPSYQTTSYYQVQSYQASLAGNAINMGNNVSGVSNQMTNQLFTTLTKATNEIGRNFQYVPQVVAMTQLSSHHVNSLSSKKVVNVLLTIDDIALKFPSMERLLDSYPLLFEVMNKTLSVPGQMMVLSIVKSRMITAQQRRCLLAFLQSLNQTSPWPRNKLVISMVSSPKNHFVDMAQSLHFPIQRNSARTSYWKNQAHSNNNAVDMNNMNALLDQQVRLLNITQNLQSLGRCSEGIIPCIMLLMPFDNSSAGNTTSMKDRSRMGQFNIPLLDLREHLFNVLTNITKHGKSIWYLNTSGDPFFGPNHFTAASLNNNNNPTALFEDKASMWARPVRLELSWSDLLVFCPIVKYSIMAMIVQRLLLVDPNCAAASTSSPHNNTSNQSSGMLNGNSTFNNVALNKILPAPMNDIHIESLASYLVLLEFFDIIEDTFHRYYFSLFNETSESFAREDSDDYRPVGNSKVLKPSQSSKSIGSGMTGNPSIWHAIVYDITQQMLQNHDLFSYSFSGSQTTYKGSGNQRQQQNNHSSAGNSWIMNYIVSNTILICERQCLHYKFFSPHEFITACRDVKSLLDAFGDPSALHYGYSTASAEQPSWATKNQQGNPASTTSPLLINWLREADLFSITFIERETKDLLYRRYLTSHVYDKYFRDWIHVLRQQKQSGSEGIQSTSVPVGVLNNNNSGLLGFIVVERNANEREITLEVSFTSWLSESSVVVSGGSLISGNAAVPARSMTPVKTTSSTSRVTEDDILKHILHDVGITDVQQASSIRDVLVHHGCNNWKDFLDSMEIVYATTSMTQSGGNIYHESIRKFLQEEMLLPLLLAMKLANYYLSLPKA